jgi:hypothetical protein
MKKIVLIATAVLLAEAALSQGTIRFINRGGTTTTAAPGQVLAPIYREDPKDPTHRISGNTSTGVPAGNTSYDGAAFVAAGQGPTFTATLWGINSTTVVGDSRNNNLVLLPNGTTIFRTDASGVFAGILYEPQDLAQVPGVVVQTDRATFQIRVWDTRGGAISTWDELMLAQNDNALRGYSDLFTVRFPLGDPGGLSSPPYLQGLQSFNLFIVPEPSVLVLGFPGVAFLLLFRLRKERNRVRV